ncbi:MAG: LacI family DNA-binding transcriptional regulator [Oscillospiraceae bacterium]|nr:LacI family DNA-binding transcriptional regulator [Oscillospiraceae bacterium]MBQ5749127.1 LacI family DNA-binding transcriptional regulator [Oscillospiraceae bacterium]
MKDVAKRTGLSLSTISKYLNGGNVREENRAAIEEAVRELDYSVNFFARGLKANRSMTVGVLLPTLSSVFFGRVVVALEKVLQESGYHVLVSSYDFCRELELNKLEFLAHSHVDGIVYVPEHATPEEIAARIGSVPLVLFDRSLPDVPYDTVVVDNLNAVYTAIERLIAKGHRRIGLIAGPQRISTALERTTGYRRVMQDYSLPIDESLIASGDYDMESGWRLFRQLMQMPDPPTAVFVTNYDMTVGAIVAAHELGIALPTDVDFIGYDNVDLCRIANPPLEIVAQPMEQIGEQAAQLVLQRIAGDDSERKLLRLKSSLVSSCDL